MWDVKQSDRKMRRELRPARCVTSLQQWHRYRVGKWHYVATRGVVIPKLSTLMYTTVIILLRDHTSRLLALVLMYATKARAEGMRIGILLISLKTKIKN